MSVAKGGMASQARALNVKPFAGDTALANAALEEIVQMIKSDPKHLGMNAITELGDADLKAAAVVVKKLAKLR